LVKGNKPQLFHVSSGKNRLIGGDVELGEESVSVVFFGCFIGHDVEKNKLTPVLRSVFEIGLGRDAAIREF
jgi:hypothetical protein